MKNWSKTHYFDQYFTPLHEAVEFENIEIIKLLLNQPKILVNKYEVYDIYLDNNKEKLNRVKQTALCRAIQLKNYEIFKLLLDQSNIFQQDLYSSEKIEDEINNDDIVVNEKNINVKTPSQFAQASESNDIIKLFETRNKDKKEEEEENVDSSIKLFTNKINKNKIFIDSGQIYVEEEEEENDDDNEEIEISGSTLMAPLNLIKSKI